METDSVDQVASKPEVVSRSVSGILLTQKTNNVDSKSSPTESSVTAPSVESTLYETPFTSLSGFDVYLSAAEEINPSRVSSLDKISDKSSKLNIANNVRPILRQNSEGGHPAPETKVQIQNESSDLDGNASNQGDFPTPTNQSPGHSPKENRTAKGKGGERIGDSGKCTPKKTAPMSPKTLPLPKAHKQTACDELPVPAVPRSESKDTITSKSHNGSVKTPSSNEEHKHIMWGIMGGTRALLIQKAKNKIIMLKVLKELRSKKSFQPISEEKERDAEHRKNDEGEDTDIHDPTGSEDREKKSFNVTPRKLREQSKFIILHYSPFKAVWDWIILFLVLYTAVFTPYVVAFLLNEDETRMRLNRDASSRLAHAQTSKADPLVLIDLIVDIMFIADILINFRTTYLHNGEVEMDPKKIAKNYVKGWFVIDTCAAIPFDLLLFGSGNSDTMTYTGFLKLARLLRLLRVLRRIEQFAEYGAAVLLLLMVTFTLIGHWLACIFYAIAYIERPQLHAKISWLDTLADVYNKPYLPNDTLSGPSIRSKYLTALYFTFTSLTSIGFGNVAPNTNAEKIFSIFAMLLGSLLSAAIFGNVSSIMLRMYQGSDEYHEQSFSIKEFINFHVLPKSLADRLIESFNHTWTYTNGIDMNNVLKTFPECLQSDICLHLNRNLLNNCPAFKNASPGCLRALSMKFKTTHAPPGDTLIHPGDILTNIFFMARGSIEILKDNAVMAILGKDDIFGADMKDTDTPGKSLYFVRALSYCDINKIEMEDLKEILQTYPEFAEDFMKKFQVTFDLKMGTLLQRKSRPTMEDETLRFIRQKRPRLQCKRRTAEPNVRANVRRRGDRRRERREDMSESEDERPGILEMSPEGATGVIVEVEEDDDNEGMMAHASGTDRKSSMSSIAGSAMTNFFNAVTGKSKKDKSSKRTTTLSKYPGHQARYDTRSNGAAHQSGLSPVDSSVTSYTPKSLSSSGPHWRFSNIEFEIQQHPDKGTLHSLSDIDNRLEGLHERMNNFENELFNTVDSILSLLGHKPSYNRDSDQQRNASHAKQHEKTEKEKTSKTKGARLIKTSSELQRVIENL